MKKSLIILAALALIGAATVRAEDAPPTTKPAHPAGGPGGPHTWGENLLPPRLLGDLALTDDQKAKYTALEEQWKKDREALQAKQDPAATAKLREEMKAAYEAKDEAKTKDLRAQMAKQNAPLMELRKQYMDKVKALLTDEQKQKLEKAMEHRPGAGRGPGGGHGPNTPPPAEPKN